MFNKRVKLVKGRYTLPEGYVLKRISKEEFDVVKTKELKSGDYLTFDNGETVSYVEFFNNEPTIRYIVNTKTLHYITCQINTLDDSFVGTPSTKEEKQVFKDVLNGYGFVIDEKNKQIMKSQKLAYINTGDAPKFGVGIDENGLFAVSDTNIVTSLPFFATERACDIFIKRLIQIIDANI